MGSNSGLRPLRRTPPGAIIDRPLRGLTLSRKLSTFPPQRAKTGLAAQDDNCYSGANFGDRILVRAAALTLFQTDPLPGDEENLLPWKATQFVCLQA
jgi:hypothetical protein